MAFELTSSGAGVLPEDRNLCRASELAVRISESSGGVFHVTEVAGCAGLALAAALARAQGETLLYVVPDNELVSVAVADARFHWSLQQGEPREHEVLGLAASEQGPYSELYPDRKSTMAQVASLAWLATPPGPRVFVTSVQALVRRVLPAEILRGACQHIEVNQAVDIEALSRGLANAGYLRLPIVEDPGTFAVRGGIVDLWSPGEAAPVRLEFEGDVVVRIRNFDPVDQRTANDRSQCSAVPARARIVSPELEQRARSEIRALCDGLDWPSSRARHLADEVAEGRSFVGSENYLPAFAELVPLLDHFPASNCVMFENAPACLAALRDELTSLLEGEQKWHDRPHFGLDAWAVTLEDLEALLAPRRVVALHRSPQFGSGGQASLDWLEFTPEHSPSLASAPMDLTGVAQVGAQRGQPSGVDQLVKSIKSWHEAGCEVVITARTQTQLQRLASLLQHRQIAVVANAEAPDAVTTAPGVRLVQGRLARGAWMPLEPCAYVTEEEVFGRRTHTHKQREKKARAPAMDIRSLTPGDFVVHEEHGVGRYAGLERREVNGVQVELLVIEYEGGKLYLPVYRLSQVQKHSTGDALPKMDRLGGASFAKTKAKIQRRLRQLADDLLQLYSERLSVKKTPLDPANDDYAAFEASFPFEETRDQATAIADVMADLESTKVMDRLVCGDVGFGKTEVALRAAFRVAMAGRQVGVLCPTTVLAQQHFLTFKNRLSSFGLEVRLLSRLVKSADSASALEGLRRGTVDVIVGTHRLLSKDVQFKNLGLLVVDEEQRFGVAHKERIKQMRREVDVMTLSATPIPRTLQMALGGLRELSVIETPPVDRRPIRTIIARTEPELLAQAVRNELSRGGQVFYVYNRIEGLDERALRIQSLVPEARLVVAHGQMRPETLERAMLRFVSGECDVLVSTAIVESGLDIPRANTMLVDRADRFGLSQLYQLRGRIGRSAERAYCYLLIPSLSELPADARARLETIEQFSELGMGLRVAAMDMELRGTGDLLGAEQSGFVTSVGFELFCRMLEEAASEARGQPVVHDVDTDLSVDLEALIPEEYINDVGIRLVYYKQLAGAVLPADVDDIAAEMEDRFGRPPAIALNLLALMRLKPELRRLKVLGCDARANSVSLALRSDTPLNIACVAKLHADVPGAYRVTPDARLVRHARSHETFEHGIAHLQCMLDEVKCATGALETSS